MTTEVSTANFDDNESEFLTQAIKVNYSDGDDDDDRPEEFSSKNPVLDYSNSDNTKNRFEEKEMKRQEKRTHNRRIAKKKRKVTKTVPGEYLVTVADTSFNVVNLEKPQNILQAPNFKETLLMKRTEDLRRRKGETRGMEHRKKWSVRT